MPAIKDMKGVNRRDCRYKYWTPDSCTWSCYKVLWYWWSFHLSKAWSAAFILFLIGLTTAQRVLENERRVDCKYCYKYRWLHASLRDTNNSASSLTSYLCWVRVWEVYSRRLDYIYGEHPRHQSVLLVESEGTVRTAQGSVSLSIVMMMLLSVIGSEGNYS